MVMLYSYGFDTFTHRHTHLKKESSDVETENSEINLFQHMEGSIFQ